MRKYFVVVMILAVIGLSLVVGKSFAVDATEAINPEAQPSLIYGKAGTGIKKFVSEPYKDSSNGDNDLIFDGACRLISITMYSDTAGDLLAIYDRGSSLPSNILIANKAAYLAAWLEFEMGLSHNTSSVTNYFNGTKFEYGIHLVASDTSNSVIGVVYDY